MLKQLKAGDSTEEIAATHGKGKGAPGRETTAAAMAAVESDLDANPSSITHSVRILAKRRGVSRNSAQRATKG